MRIKKVSQASIPEPSEAQIVDGYSTSTTNGYSCNYINGIIESGSNANGTYIKYADGTMICTGSKNKTVNITSSWGSLYSSGNGSFVFNNFAQSFISVPVVTFSLVNSSYAAFYMVDQNNLLSTTSPRWNTTFKGNINI